MNIKDSALTFQPRTTRNITELPSIPVELDLKVEEATDQDGEKFSYQYFELNDLRYRMPDSVLSSLKAILQKKPGLKTFSVIKSGEGRNTRYTVIPQE